MNSTVQVCIQVQQYYNIQYIIYNKIKQYSIILLLLLVLILLQYSISINIIEVCTTTSQLLTIKILAVNLMAHLLRQFIVYSLLCVYVYHSTVENAVPIRIPHCKKLSFQSCFNCNISQILDFVKIYIDYFSDINNIYDAKKI